MNDSLIGELDEIKAAAAEAITKKTGCNSEVERRLNRVREEIFASLPDADRTRLESQIREIEIGDDGTNYDEEFLSSIIDNCDQLSSILNDSSDEKPEEPKIQTGSTIVDQLNRHPVIFAIFLFGSIASIIALILGSNGDEPDPRDDPPKIPDVQVHAHRLSKIDSSENFEFEGMVNVDPIEGEFNYTDEYIRLEFGFDRPRYVMAIAFTPGDEGVHLLWPQNPEDGKTKRQAILIPRQVSSNLSLDLETVNDNMIGSVSEYWKLDNGEGLHAFLAISSETLLPQYDKDLFRDIYWEPMQFDATRWWIKDSEIYVAEFRDSVPMAALRAWSDTDNAKFDIRKFLNDLSSKFEEARIDGLAFPVESIDK